MDRGADSVGDKIMPNDEYKNCIMTTGQESHEYDSGFKNGYQAGICEAQKILIDARQLLITRISSTQLLGSIDSELDKHRDYNNA